MKHFKASEREEERKDWRNKWSTIKIWVPDWCFFLHFVAILLLFFLYMFSIIQLCSGPKINSICEKKPAAVSYIYQATLQIVCIRRLFIGNIMLCNSLAYHHTYIEYQMGLHIMYSNACAFKCVYVLCTLCNSQTFSIINQSTHLRFEFQRFSFSVWFSCH